MNIDEIIEKTPEKLNFKWTTSRKFKRDMYEFFNAEEFRNKSCLEIGSAYGHTSAVLCSLFKQFYGINIDTVSVSEAIKTCESFGINNFKFYVRDVYVEGLPDVVADVILVDAVHTYSAVLTDVKNSLKLKSDGKKYFVFDDVGLFPVVYNAVAELCSSGVLKAIKDIGHVPGDAFLRPLNCSEGVICVEI